MTSPPKCPKCWKIGKALGYLASPLLIAPEYGELIEVDWLSHPEALEDQILRAVEIWNEEQQPLEGIDVSRECSRFKPKE